MESLDPKTIYTILHLFGVAFGAGAAYVSDSIFLFSIKDRVLDKSEFNILKRGGAVTWFGLTLLGVSGVLLFSTNPEGYLGSSKFITKMIIVLVIALNGVIFHAKHLKTLRRLVGKNMADSALFRKQSAFMYASGALSFTSWSLALILGGLRSIPLTVSDALLIYAGLVLVALIGSQVLRRMYLRK